MHLWDCKLDLSSLSHRHSFSCKERMVWSESGSRGGFWICQMSSCAKSDVTLPYSTEGWDQWAYLILTFQLQVSLVKAYQLPWQQVVTSCFGKLYLNINWIWNVLERDTKVSKQKKASSFGCKYPLHCWTCTQRGYK